MGPLVTTDWLAAELGKPDLVVFDATKYLPNENKDGRAEFLRARIPGGRYFDIDLVADPDTDLPHMVPTPGRFAKLMSASGVSNASRLVFYDQKGLASAARGWWLMTLFGHDKAAPVRAAKVDFSAKFFAHLLLNFGVRYQHILNGKASAKSGSHVPSVHGGFYQYCAGTAEWIVKWKLPLPT